MPEKTAGDRVQKASQREFREVHKIIKNFDKAFHVMKVYPADSPAVINNTEVFFLDIIHFLEAYDNLILGVESDAFLFEEKAVVRYESETKSLPFLFFKDGVREISFYKGLEKEELTDFLWMVKSNAELPLEESDIVTALWEKNFPHIGYFALDDFLDTDIGSIEDQSVFEVEKENFSQGTIHLDNEDSPGKDKGGSLGQGGDFEGARSDEGRGSPFPSLLPKEAASGALSEEEEKTLQTQINDIRNASPLNELITLVFEVLYLEDRHFQFSALLNVLEKCLNDAVQEGTFEQAVLALRRLKELQNIFSGQNEEKVLLIQKFRDKVRINTSTKILSDLYKEGKIMDMNAFFDYLKFLGHKSLPLLCKILDEAEDSPIRHRSFGIVDSIVRENINELASHFSKFDKDTVKTIIPIIVSIGEKGIIPLLASLSESKNPEIKKVLIHSLGTFEYGYANRSLLKFLHDKDPAIRLMAANNFQYPADEPVIEALLDLVQKKRFKKRKKEEMTEIFKFLSGTDDNNVYDALRSILNKSSFFGKKKNDKLRLAVVEGLEKNGSPKAAELLLEGRLNRSKLISRACAESLEKLSKTNKQKEYYKKQIK